MLKEDIYSDLEYINIVNEYLQDDYVQSLKNIPHHNINRLEHSLKVSHLAYKICKKLNLNYESAARAGLLHDFYFNRIDEQVCMSDKIKLFTNEHPEDAVANASKRFLLSSLEKDIIISHMWPVSTHIPKYRESFIVSLSDKIFSFDEFGKKWGYYLSFSLGVYFIFITHLIFK